MPEEENREILSTIVKGAGIAGFGMFFSKFVTYLYRLLIAKIGTGAYGQFSQAVAVVSIVSVICGLSLGNSLEKFIPEFRESKSKAKIKGIVVSALQLTTLMSILFGIALFLSAPFIASYLSGGESLVKYIRILAIMPVFTRAYEVFMDTLVSFKKIKYKVLSTNILESIFQISIAAVLILILDMGVTGAVIAYIASTALCMLIAFYFVESKVGPILLDMKTKGDRMYSTILKFSLPLLAYSFINLVMGHMDTLFLGYFTTDSAVGLYNAAFPTAVLVSLPASAIGSLALPSFSEMRQKDVPVGRTVKNMTRWAFIFTFPGLLGIAVFSSEILNILFGSAYAPAGLAMTVVAIGFVFNSSMGYLVPYLKSESKNKFILKAQIVNLVLNGALNIYLIPTYGIEGAAAGTTVSTIVFGLIIVAFTYKKSGVIPWELHFLKIIVSSILSMALVYGILKMIYANIPPLAVFPAGGAYFFIYLLIYAFLGIKEEDWEMWYRILEKLSLLKLWRSIFS
jgi:O-antigen/teichoic acid export membrane protein